MRYNDLQFFKLLIVPQQEGIIWDFRENGANCMIVFSTENSTSPAPKARSVKEIIDKLGEYICKGWLSQT